MRVSILFALITLVYFAIAFASLRQPNVHWDLLIRTVAWLSLAISLITAFHRRSTEFFAYAIFFLLSLIVLGSEAFTIVCYDTILRFRSGPGDQFSEILYSHVQIVIGLLAFAATRMLVQRKPGSPP